MAKATFVQRVQQAVDKIGTHNGTAVPEGIVPAEIKKNNLEANTWHDRYKAVAEFLVASTIKKHAEAREKKARAAMLLHLRYIDKQKLIPGTRESHKFDSVAVAVEIRAGQTRLDKALLLSNLVKSGKLSFDEANKVISDSEKIGEPAIYLTPSTTVD